MGGLNSSACAVKTAPLLRPRAWNTSVTACARARASVCATSGWGMAFVTWATTTVAVIMTAAIVVGQVGRQISMRTAGATAAARIGKKYSVTTDSKRVLTAKR